jgi:hypothetical protein
MVRLTVTRWHIVALALGGIARPDWLRELHIAHPRFLGQRDQQSHHIRPCAAGVLGDAVQLGDIR